MSISPTPDHVNVDRRQLATTVAEMVRQGWLDATDHAYGDEVPLHRVDEVIEQVVDSDAASKHNVYLCESCFVRLTGYLNRYGISICCTCGGDGY
ncbi:hypothetical protein ACFV1N_48510 [Streptosporangium canum]|uniref:hypothetical protein n=1 Tax=Streptosporangium canum TaxID=324952 RepID=UPI0036BE16FE